MYNIHPTDFLIFSFDREAFQSKVLFQRPLVSTHPLCMNITRVSLFLFLQGIQNQAFQLFCQFRIVDNHLLGCIASLAQLGVVVAEP